MVTAEMIAKVRRLTNEPTADTYSDAAITAMLEEALTLDPQGRRPYSYSGTTLDPQYIPTYDAYRVAALIWEEKAAALALEFDYSGDGASMSLSQKHAQCLQQAATCNARSSVRVIMPVREGFQGVEEEHEYLEHTGTGNA